MFISVLTCMQRARYGSKSKHCPKIVVLISENLAKPIQNFLEISINNLDLEISRLISGEFELP